MVIGDSLATRDNNLNLIRALAAVAVLVSHAWPIALGKGTPEPLQAALGHSLGTLAVYVFFAASGYLVAESFRRRTSMAAFTLARAARLLPGLLVSLGLVAFVLGPAVTTLPLASYATHPDTAGFLLGNAVLFLPRFTLPGVFETNPYPIVEGSIWTLKYEVACYAGLALAGLTGLLARRSVATLALAGFIGGAAVAQATGLRTVHQLDQLLVLAQPFAFGMLAHVWRDRLAVQGTALAMLVLVTALAHGGAAYDLLLVATVSYGTLALAVVPAGWLRLYNRLGDYSYGIYLYAVPLQGLAVWAFGPQSPTVNIALSLPPTVALAVLSWRYVERPALEAARAFSARAAAPRARPAPSARPVPRRTAAAGRPVPPG